MQHRNNRNNQDQPATHESSADGGRGSPALRKSPVSRVLLAVCLLELVLIAVFVWPDDRYHEDAVWRGELERNYEAVATPALGDLVFLLRRDGSPLHAAVHIADDVVFTKNGGSERQPWILMKWEDLVARYPENYPVRTATFRQKRRMP